MEEHAAPSRGLFGERSLSGLIGESAPMCRLYELIGKISQSNSPVLLLGETGTGKELVARAIHFTGLRCEKALVPIDCSALTPTLSRVRAVRICQRRLHGCRLLEAGSAPDR